VTISSIVLVGGFVLFFINDFIKRILLASVAFSCSKGSLIWLDGCLRLGGAFLFVIRDSVRGH
jgi:hypothetical protein